MTEIDDQILGLLRTNGPMTVRHIVEVYQMVYGYIGAHKVYYSLWRLADKRLVRKAGTQARAIRWGKDPDLYEVVE